MLLPVHRFEKKCFADLSGSALFFFFLFLFLFLFPHLGGAQGVSSASSTLVASSPALCLPVNIGRGLTNFATVSADLYRGAQPTADGFKTLEAMGIKTVINLRAFHDDAKLLVGTGLNYVHITFEPWSPNVDEVILFLKIVADPSKRPVFVHCQHGADRTGTMVAFYRMINQNWTCAKALEELPRFGFHRIWSNLKIFMSSLNIPTLQELVKKR
ncbi:MAG: dual specificity protein phosphatase family protein [Candidatus Ozemobacteraceae bacterium]